MKNRGANSCSQWVLFPNCAISCTHCSWAGSTTHFSFKEEERMKSAGAVLPWESSALHLSPALLTNLSAPEQGSAGGCPMALTPGWTGSLPSPVVPVLSPGFPGKWLPQWSLNVPCW